MKIYIASSWRNAHGVELLTKELRTMGHEVSSWVENNYGENHNHVTRKMDFESWVNSDESAQSFQFDTYSAVYCDLFIYYGPAGMDACAELGAAWAIADGISVGHKKIIGLWAKGEGIGLMRKMVDQWFSRPQDLLNYVDSQTLDNYFQSIEEKINDNGSNDNSVRERAAEAHHRCPGYKNIVVPGTDSNQFDDHRGV